MSKTIMFNSESDLSIIPEDITRNPRYTISVFNPETEALCESYALNYDTIIWNIERRDFIYFVQGIEDEESFERTHAEIMTNWFRRDEAKNWFKVVAYNYDSKEYIGYSYLLHTEAFSVIHFTKEAFNGFEMSELPQE